MSGVRWLPMFAAVFLVACAGGVASPDDDVLLDAPFVPTPLPEVDPTFQVDPRNPTPRHRGTAWVVAHPDDDLLFMNPDVEQVLSEGGPSTTFVLTAGDNGEGPSYWRRREAGLRAAYARMTAMPDHWHESTLQVGDKSLAVASLDRRPEVRLLFVRLPDGGFDATTGGGQGTPRYGRGSLSKLWAGQIPKLTSVDGTVSFTRAELLDTLAAVFSRLALQRVGALEPLSSVGFDHADHLASARFAVRAARMAHVAQIDAYRGYSLFDRHHAIETPINLDENEKRQKRLTFLAYCPYDHIACPPIGDYAEWLLRRHVRRL